MPENKRLSRMTNPSLSSSYGNDGANPVIDQLPHSNRFMTHPTVQLWIASGADVSDLAISEAADELIDLAQDEVMDKPKLMHVIKFAESVINDVVNNNGRIVKADIQGSWPHLLNWASTKKGFANSLLSQDRLERNLVKEYILLLGLKTVNVLDAAFEPKKEYSKLHGTRVKKSDNPRLPRSLN